MTLLPIGSLAGLDRVQIVYLIALALTLFVAWFVKVRQEGRGDLRDLVIGFASIGSFMFVLLGIIALAKA
jgi:hypothetical protein